MSTDDLKNQILDLIDDLYGDNNADEKEQIAALEEIGREALMNAQTLRASIGQSEA